MKQLQKEWHPGLGLKYKKARKGPELELVESFMDSSNPFFDSDTLTSRFFNEPFIGTAIPDIVIASWDKNIFDFWVEKRNYLEIRDIKILHYMHLQGIFLDLPILKNTLGYSCRETEETLQRLIEAGLLLEETEGFKAKSLENIFYVKAIISIEAKIKDWKKAFEQAWLNGWFASESYVLLPQERINPKIIEYAANLGIGLISHQENETSIVSKADKKEIPASYSSWLFNEVVGRELFYENY